MITLPGDSHDAIEHDLSEPCDRAVEAVRQLEGDIILLGVGGKMGPTLAMLARRASDAAGISRRVIGVARFSEQGLADRLQRCGVEAVRCDLLDRAALAALPDVPNVVFMAGRKFGSTGGEALTWAMNSYMPGLVCERYPDSRIVAFSTGNVYGLVPIAGGGSREDDPLRPVGEYAMSCVGRERMFEHFSAARGTRVALLRLNYAVEYRYGVIVDLAHKVWNGQPVDLTMGYFNAIWQPDANAMALSAFSLASSPARAVNVTGPRRLSVREVCERLAAIQGREARFTGAEANDALLTDSSLACQSLGGPPRVSVDEMIERVAHWVMRGGASLDKPTHFESRSGAF